MGNPIASSFINGLGMCPVFDTDEEIIFSREAKIEDRCCVVAEIGENVFLRKINIQEGKGYLTNVNPNQPVEMIEVDLDDPDLMMYRAVEAIRRRKI